MVAPQERPNDEKELNSREWAQARKQTLLQGYCDMHYHQEASPKQLWCLHQIELAVKSVNEDDL